MRLLVVVLIVSVASIVVIGLAFSWWQASSTPPPSAGHACGVSDDQWHPPVVGSCQVGHEHGDAPPAWVTLRYTGAFNTSVHENGHGPDAANPTRVGKHEAMKGQSWSAGGLDYYVRYHGNSNVLDRMARFHSSEVWVRESSNGKVSHIALWGNSGDPQKFGDGQAGAGGRRNTCSAEIDIRPEVHVVTTMTDYQTCNAAEFWYLYPSGPGPDAPGSWGPTVSFLVNATTLAFANEAANPSMTTWQTTGALGIARQVKVEINGPSAPIKDQPFWTTQFLELVSGPTDPKCSATTTFAAQPGDTINPFVHAETYQHVCLQQFISGTLPAFSSTSPGKDFSAPGLRLPN